MFWWRPRSALLSCSPQMYSSPGKSPEKELNSPNNPSNLKLIRRVLALWRVISKQRPELSSQKKVQFSCYCLFCWNWKLSFPAMGVWELQPSRYFLCPKRSYWQNPTQTAIQPLWVKIKTVSRTFISAIKAINWFLGHVLTQMKEWVLLYGTHPYASTTWNWRLVVEFGLNPVSHKNTILPRGSEGRQTALINWKKTAQCIFPLIEKADWECNYPN